MNDTCDDRLENMLRAWGDSCGGRATDQCLTLGRAAAFAEAGPADQAEADHVLACPICARLVGRFEAEPPDAADRLARPSSGRAWRWAPLAAAALLVAVGLVALAAMVFHREADSLALSAARAEADDLRTRLGALAAVTEGLVDERKQAQMQAAGLSAKLGEVKAEEGRLRADLELRLAKLADGARTEGERRDRQLQALREDLRGSGEKLTAALALAARHEAEAARVRGNLSRQIERLEARYAERLAVVRTTWKMLRGSAQVSQVGPAVLSGMQSTARSADLAARAGVLSASAPAKATADLLNRLEGILLRLDLADPNDRFDQRWIATMVAADVIDAIDAALAAEEAGERGVSDELRTFLTQVQVVLLRGVCAT